MQDNRKAKFTRQLKKAGWTDAEIMAAMKNATFTSEVGPELPTMRRRCETLDLSALMGISGVPVKTATMLAVTGADLGGVAKQAAAQREAEVLVKSKAAKTNSKKRAAALKEKQAVVTAATADLRRQHPGIRRDDLLDLLVVKMGEAGHPYKRSTLSRMMPAKKGL